MREVRGGGGGEGGEGGVWEEWASIVHVAVGKASLRM